MTCSKSYWFTYLHKTCWIWTAVISDFHKSSQQYLILDTIIIPIGQMRKGRHRSDLFMVNTIQFSSVAQSCLTLCGPMNRSMPGIPVHHQLPEFTQTHAHRVGDAIQPSHPLSSPSPPAPSLSQYQGLFQWVNSSHEVAKVLEFQL